MAKKSKYADVCKDLPRLEAGDPVRQDAVNVIRTQITTAEGLVAPKNTVDELMRLADNYARLAVDAMKLYAVSNLTPGGFAASYAECRTVRDKMKAWDSLIGLVIEAYQQLMVNAMEAEDLAAIRLSSGQLISVRQEPYPTIVDREAYRLWCLEDADLAKKMQLHHKILEGLVKARLLEGEAPPPGIEVKSMTKVSMTGAGGDE